MQTPRDGLIYALSWPLVTVLLDLPEVEYRNSSEAYIIKRREAVECSRIW